MDSIEVRELCVGNGRRAERGFVRHCRTPWLAVFAMPFAGIPFRGDRAANAVPSEAMLQCSNAHMTSHNSRRNRDFVQRTILDGGSGTRPRRPADPLFGGWEPSAG